MEGNSIRIASVGKTSGVFEQDEQSPEGVLMRDDGQTDPMDAEFGTCTNRKLNDRRASGRMDEEERVRMSEIIKNPYPAVINQPSSSCRDEKQYGGCDIVGKQVAEHDVNITEREHRMLRSPMKLRLCNVANVI